MAINLRLEISPVAKRRVRARVRPGNGSKARAMVYKDSKSRQGEELFITTAIKYRPIKPLDGPLSMRILAYLNRPKSCRRKAHTIRPDLDNLVKFVMDCLTRAGFYHDDAQIVKLSAYKGYISEEAGKPYWDITINECAQ